LEKIITIAAFKRSFANQRGVKIEREGEDMVI